MKSTSVLLNDISASPSAEVFLSRNEESFADKLFQKQVLNHIAAKRITKLELVKRSYLNASYVYDILNAKKRPSRDTVLRLAFGLRLNLAECNRLLKFAEYSDLYPRDKRDAVIIFHIMNGSGLPEANDQLHEMDLPLLFLAE